jgi:hypothetical protein
MGNPSRTSAAVDPKDVASKMKFEYSRGAWTPSTKVLDAVTRLCWQLENRDMTADAMIREVANSITKHLGIASVAIATRDPLDKLYRYKAVIGLDDQAVRDFMRIVYTKEQLMDANTYPSYEISSRTRLYLGEDHPYAPGEEFGYKRPGLLGMNRGSLTENLEADYLDFYFPGADGDIAGFIETSGTKFRQLPDTSTILWIELIASILGHALRLKK